MEGNPVRWVDYFGLWNIDFGSGVNQEASLGLHLMNQVYSAEQINSILTNRNKGESIFSYHYTVYAFFKNYMDMRNANTIGADKYFHCKANCESAKNGSDASWLACKISNVREIFDQRVKGDPRNASIEDQIANHHGRNNANFPFTCETICNKFRPNGLNNKY